MNSCKKIIVALVILVWSFSALSAIDTKTTDTKILFYTQNWLKNSIDLWEFQAWESKSFSWKVINNSNEDLDVFFWFVDWVTDSDGKNLWCKNEWEWDSFWNYVTLSAPWAQLQEWNKITIDPNGEIDLNFTIRTPGTHNYSWKIVWCITHYSTWVSDTWCNFSLLTRKANFVNLVINGSIDPTIPYVDNVNWQAWNHQINLGEQSIWHDITIEFSEQMDTNSVTNSLILEPNISWPLTVDWQDGWKTLTIHLLTWRFDYDKSYTLKIGTWAKDLLWWNNMTWIVQINFKTNTNPENQWWSQWWGWGGGWWWGWWGWGGGWWWYDKPEVDNCPDWDFSESYYDWDCGEYKEAEEDKHGSSETTTRSCDVLWSEYSDELNQAYIYACNIGITTMPTIQQADMMWPLLRKHLAKMISEFSVKVLWINPDTSKVCNFQDMDNETQEMKYFAQMSCQLWLMWLHSDWITVKDNFDPNEPVTRAQFGTVLSRLLWGTTYATEDGSLYYVKHLDALKNNNIMTQIYWDWPHNIEMRWRVMLMLMRVNENNLVSHYSPWTWDVTLQWTLALIDDWNIHVTMPDFDDWIMYTTLDFVPIKWSIDPSQPVYYIYVTHSNSKWKWLYNNYKLTKFKPQDHDFVFYAYRHYNSMTMNDKNSYEFKFYDKNNKLLFKRTVVINHNYVWRW